VRRWEQAGGRWRERGWEADGEGGEEDGEDGRRWGGCGREIGRGREGDVEGMGGVVRASCLAQCQHLVAVGRLVTVVNTVNEDSNSLASIPSWISWEGRHVV